MQAFGEEMLRKLQGFAAMSQMKRLALLLLARTYTDKDVIRLKVSQPCFVLSQTDSVLIQFVSLCCKGGL